MPFFTKEDMDQGNWCHRTEELMAMVNLYHSKNEELKEENEELKEQITCLESDSYNEVSLTEYEELKEENEELKMNTHRLNCSHCNLISSEDDIFLSLDCGEFTCEECFNEGKSKNIKEENEELRKRDEEAMELTMAQNERFMDQLEEQEKIKEKLAEKINILKNGLPDKYKVGDMLKCYCQSNELGIKFLKIVGSTKSQYKVCEIINEHNRVMDGQDWTDYYKVPKDTSLWKYKDHKNITKKRSLKFGISLIKEDTRGLDSDTHYVSKAEYYD
tara:strand:+ start:43 stop:864 length:822 start_codon:yes stop_codon:yes gene_type:complete